MNKIIMFKKVLVPATLILALSSCATRYKEQKVRSISNEINNFKDNTHRSELSDVILEKQVEKPLFLKQANSKAIHKWINYFSKKDLARFKRFLKNGAKYKKAIRAIFKEHKLPEDLFYVGLIESGYYLKAKSRANAVGPWQFIKSTAKRYDLVVNSSVDERRNIIKATHAAARYFQDLYNIFGSWELALSAYNAGEYGVIRRIRTANTRDFYELSKRKKLPRETRNYVPKVIAAMEIAKNPRRYGITLNQERNTIYTNTKTLTLHKRYRLTDIAKRMKISSKILKDLNNDINARTTPYKRSGYSLIIPANGSQLNTRSLAAIKPVKRQIKRKSANNKRTKEFMHYKVRKGDTLIGIAKKNRIYVQTIKNLNRLKRSRIFVGQKLKLPKRDIKHHVVRKGDYLIKIAKKYKTSVAMLRKLNRSSLRRIYPGQKIVIKYN